MSIKAQQIVCKGDGETITPAASFLDSLRSGELLTGTPTAAEQTTDDLTISNVAVNTSTLSIDGRDHVAGQAVQMKIVGGTAGKSYLILVTASTDATPAQTLELLCRLDVE